VKRYDRVRVNSLYASVFHGREGFVADVEGEFMPYHVRLDCGLNVWFHESELEMV
jgi:hypothetical protein